MRLTFVNDDDINRHTEPAQDAPQTDGLPHRIVDYRLDHKQIDVGSQRRLIPGTRTEQHHPGTWRGGVSQASPDFVKHGLLDHTPTVPPNQDEMRSTEANYRAWVRLIDAR